jgi:tape measure domain-containing protein
VAAQVGALRVAVGADISGLTTGMKRAERQVAKSAGVMSNAVKGLNARLSGLGAIGGISLGAAGLLGAGTAFIKAADAAKQLTAQLKLATAEFGSFAKANKDVRDIAEQTRSGLVETAQLYAALQRNSGQLGTTQTQVARATRTVAEAFTISGAATSEQSAATRQLIQAFQSGVLRGDEFNSIMENAPRLARLLADSLGVTTGKLRAMAEAGQLTADKLVKAFTDKKFTAAIDAEFKQLPVTFDQAMTQVYNAAIVTFSAFDRGGQFSTALANFVTDGSQGFAQLEERAYSFGKQVSDLLTAIETIHDALGSLKTDGVFGFGALIDSTYSWRDALADTLGVIDGVINQFSNLLNLPGNAIRTAFPGLGLQPIVNPSDMRGDFLGRTNKKDVAASRQAIFGRSAADVLSEFGLSRNPPPYKPPPAKAKKAKKGKAAPRDRSDDVEFQFAQELRQAQADVLRAQQSMAVTNEERARIALLLLDAEKASKNAELDERVRKAERDFAEKKITAGALEQVKTQAAKLRAEYDSVDSLERQAIANDLAADKANDTAELADSSYDIRLEQLQNESALADTAAEKREVELRILDLMKQQEKARLEAVIADVKSSELAKAQAQQRLDALDAIYAGREETARQGTRGPMGDWLASLPTTAAKAQEAMEQLQVQGFEGLIDAAVALTEGFDNAKDALLDTIKQFLQGILRMQLQKGLGSLFGSGGFNFGSIFGGGATSTGGMSASSPSFVGPRFAGGGSFTVKGMQGIDRNTLMLNGIPIANVSYGERVSVSNDNPSARQSYGRGGDVIINGVTDFDTFRRNKTQVGRLARRGLGL